jgi:hypothetical protein
MSARCFRTGAFGDRGARLGPAAVAREDARHEGGLLEATVDLGGAVYPANAPHEVHVLRQDKNPSAAPPAIKGNGPSLENRAIVMVPPSRPQVKISEAACGAICITDTPRAPITAGATPRMNALMRRRNPNALLSSAEVSVLRRVASGLAKFLSSDVRELLMSMGLISLTLGGRLVLTEEGKRRLAEETARNSAR